jgi:hypothetical protein
MAVPESENTTFVSRFSGDEPATDGSLRSTVKKSAGAPGSRVPPSKPILVAPLVVAQANNRCASASSLSSFSGAKTLRAVWCKRR